MCPRSARLVNGSGGWLERGRMVAHCLVVESDSGLVLVDSGISALDIERPERLPLAFRLGIGPDMKRTRPAIEQIEELGLDPRDVQHIVVTHLDVDHAGGIADFHWATVHVHSLELRAARLRASRIDRERYVPVQWGRHTKWHRYDDDGDTFFGLQAVRPLFQLSDDFALVPLFGHTAGHSGVAVRSERGWLLHAGDAYFHRGEMESPPAGSPGLDFFQRMVQRDGPARLDNQRRLRTLRQDHQDEVTVFSAHDPVEFDTLRAASGQAR
jgi:glyoxylase-like metal-dependent hydrolase (beta-lactamase superfamily II)